MKKYPSVSIILCTHNGEKKIEKSLSSLISQNYPSDKYEIIVVDDGSTDNTQKILRKYKVKALKHKTKRGLAASRNTGLKIATGDIVACYDDDCTADKNWLRNLVRGFEDQGVMGCGGLMKLSDYPTLTDQYLFESGYASPIPTTLGKSKSIFVRFCSYLETNFTNPQAKYEDGIRVYELPGAMSSFRKKQLIQMGGWNEQYKNIAEDVELCRRMRAAYPDYYFVVMPSAKVVHEQQMTFYGFLKKEFSRGKLRKQYYHLKNEVPPYFPGPIIIFVVTMFTFITPTILPFLLLLPLAIYPWWIFRSISQGNIKMILFPYMQWLHETAIVMGMI